jgi:hypothetical protein
MHEKKNIFIFLEEINLKNLRFFLIFKETFWRIPGVVTHFGFPHKKWKKNKKKYNKK